MDSTSLLCKYGDYESIKSFADVGIDINLKTNDEKNILHITANYGNLNLCKALGTYR